MLPPAQQQTGAAGWLNSTVLTWQDLETCRQRDETSLPTAYDWHDGDVALRLVWMLISTRLFASAWLKIGVVPAAGAGRSP